jgi:hypothetical protein
VVLAQLLAEEVLDNADMIGQGFHADRVVSGWRGEQDAVRSDRALILRLVATVETVLEEMQRHTKTFETKFVGQTEFAEAEEVLVEVFGKVAADELFAPVVEGADAVCACVVAEGRSL